MEHESGCPANDPFAHLLGDYGVCTCGPRPDKPIAYADLMHEWLNMWRGNDVQDALRQAGYDAEWVRRSLEG
jgi:hypothetical protein